MDDLGLILKKERTRQNISIDEVTEKLRIRKHILEGIENGQKDVLPDVYLRAFLRSYAEFLKIPKSEIEKYIENRGEEPKYIPPVEAIPEQPKKPLIEKITPPKKESSPPKAKKTYFEEPEHTPSNYAELFKKSNVQNTSRTNWMNIAIYSVIFLAVVAVIYFSFFYNGSSPEIFNAQNSGSENALAAGDTAVIGEKKKDLFSQFAEPDSLTLTAKALDTAWLRVNMDNLRSEELLMKPGMQQSWKAGEFFVINQGNAGAIEYSRNGDILAPMASRGMVIRGVKITKDTVLNTTVGDGSATSSRKTKEKPKKRIRLIEPLPEAEEKNE